MRFLPIITALIALFISVPLNVSAIPQGQSQDQSQRPDPASVFYEEIKRDNKVIKKNIYIYEIKKKRSFVLYSIHDVSY
ncbi:hypothetical protein RCL_jg22776.t1 [Rhizophagus clarus]|uniref:Uncharacterized protein n=1 Tax=Rhizophagus clarus TaxID=94130 RepID=A0A8H3QMC7_9GLOM|nr:hypothetical protein RCL_jg22776.t1 [Rhizophagus clarus]